MLVKYYNNEELSYANRKRYISFNFEPFNQEELKKIVLGDGANTEIKTSSNNICNYVTIDNTRWFVTSYIYLNGGQVKLFLQRDVVGEFGISNSFGKIERGYTDSVLKNRKELSLNQILKERKYLIPSSNTYGNYYVDNHDNELWGILYFTKKYDTQEDEVNINIPEFSPKIWDYPIIDDGTQRLVGENSNCGFEYIIKIIHGVGTLIGSFKISTKYYYINKEWIYKNEITEVFLSKDDEITAYIVCNQANGYNINEVVNAYANQTAEDIMYNTGNYNSFFFPEVPDIEPDNIDYTGVNVKNENNIIYTYISGIKDRDIYASVNIQQFIELLTNLQRVFTRDGFEFRVAHGDNDRSENSCSMQSLYVLQIKTYVRRQLSAEESGNIVISMTNQLVDEPYSILVFPLYNVNIKNNITEESFSIERQRAFNIFNTVIQSLSGENPYIVDAQVYPYCPLLGNVNTKISSYPFFSILSNTYNHEIEINLYPYSDVKKEYIKREYSIISPEQSGKFNFNFYDYKTVILDNGGVNFEKIKIIIKTALKPYAIISSAVIVPDNDSIKGITYLSDLRGSSPSSNGFECSLASNAFETYKRQNSNYQQIFALQKEEMSISHETERVNEKVSGVVNTLSATMMGAIGGAALTDYSAFGFSAKGAGAAVGASVAGATVGIANAIQYSQNEKLRQYEEYLLQQNFDLQIGTIKNLPVSINRISSFNEIILKDFWYVIEIYECSEYESNLVDTFITKYAYSLGVYGNFSSFIKNGWFIKGSIVTSYLITNLHNILYKELKGGIYIYE